MSLNRRQFLGLSLCAVPALGKGVLDWQRENLLIASQLEGLAGGARFLLLEPEPGDAAKLRAHPKDYFHAHRIQGAADISQVQARDLCKALTRSLHRYSIRDGVTACFEPRHGLRFPQLDLLICFKCSQLYAYGRGRPQHGYLRGGEDAFQRMTRNLGL